MQNFNIHTLLVSAFLLTSCSTSATNRDAMTDAITALNGAVSAEDMIEPTTDQTKQKAPPTKEKGLPENVVKSADGQTFISFDLPVGDCKAYRLYAPPGHMVVMVVYYKHEGNIFTPIREGAICE